jgi:hypothetical protein
MMKTISTSVSGFLYTKSEGELRILLTGMTQRGLLKQDGQSFATATKLQQQS